MSSLIIIKLKCLKFSGLIDKDGNELMEDMRGLVDEKQAEDLKKVSNYNH